MLNILVPVDGSKYSENIARYLIELNKYTNGLEIHLLNVQIQLSGDINMFIDKDQIDRYRHDEGLKALQKTRELLDKAGISYTFHIGVGHTAETIVNYAKEKQCTQIVMAMHGLGSISSLLMGSVVTKVIHLSPVPITLVK